MITVFYWHIGKTGLWTHGLDNWALGLWTLRLISSYYLMWNF